MFLDAIGDVLPSFHKEQNNPILARIFEEENYCLPMEKFYCCFNLVKNYLNIINQTIVLNKEKIDEFDKFFEDNILLLYDNDENDDAICLGRFNKLNNDVSEK